MKALLGGLGGAIGRFDITPSQTLLTSVKERVVFLATDPSVNNDVQLCAQNTLKSGWILLLPQVNERARMLPSISDAGHSG